MIGSGGKHVNNIGARAQRSRLASTVSLLMLAADLGLALPSAASAQAEPASPAPPPPVPVQTDSHRGNPDEILVIGNRAIVGSMIDVPVEQSFDQDDLVALGVSTVGEVLDELRNDFGDDDPSILVNGRPVADINDIANLPVEAIERIETLPRGSATRIGGTSGQRAYNVVLRNAVKSATFTGSREVATEGSWHNYRGEAIFTYIRGQDRLNLSIRGAQSSLLQESERSFIPRTQATPFSPFGNILPASGLEVDPLFSALAGQPVSVIALPTGGATPSLASLLPGANRINPSELENYRSLRGASRPIEVALAGNKILTPWLSLAVNGRLSWSQTESLSGLPAARFLIPQTNPSTPFSTPVFIAVNDPARPLQSLSEGNTQSLSATFNASLGTWRGALNGRWDRREQTNLFEFTGSLAGGLGTIEAAINPFEGALGSRIPVNTRESSSRYNTTQVSAEFDGPLVSLWAGPVTARSSLGGLWLNYAATDSLGPKSFERTELSARAGVNIPLTSREAGFLREFGNTDIDLDYTKVDLGQFGSLVRWSVAFNWQFVPWLRLVARSLRDEFAIQPELISSPEVISPNVPYFDPISGETVDVTTVFGGVAGLSNEQLRTRALGLTATPFSSLRFQFDGEYSINTLRNQIGSLPFPPSSAVIEAFPERFVRDDLGTLILVDTRSVNFDSQRTSQLRLGIRFTVPLEPQGAMQAATAGSPRRRAPQLNLQFNGSHTIVLSSMAIIREGLPEVDLLEGGAIGIGGGQQRHVSRANLALTRGGTGVRLEYARRGAGNLAFGTLADPDQLRFGSLSTINLRLIADLQEFFPSAQVTRGTRLTATFKNLCNERQTVRNLAGATPQAYQPVRRDPIGRTIMLELRKVF